MLKALAKKLQFDPFVDVEALGQTQIQHRRLWLLEAVALEAGHAEGSVRTIDAAADGVHDWHRKQCTRVESVPLVPTE